MLRDIKKFAALNRDEKVLFLEAFFWLGIMRAAILTVSFKRLTRGLKHSARQETSPILSGEQKDLACTIGGMIEKAANNTPWESACLVQALTAQRMLARRGIPGCFFLGAGKAGHEEAPSMKAHAWTLCADAIITGSSGHEAYAVLSVFEWSAK